MQKCEEGLTLPHKLVILTHKDVSCRLVVSNLPHPPHLHGSQVTPVALTPHPQRPSLFLGVPSPIAIR